ncbi:heat shock 70 kDa protein 12B-like [Ruditapes philippinarum]|uniref:heat shock 70 kDa protein 12B-like n=1 Tax=Ruditapes philippinarum TaxID=129788 RepID=UPI00295ABE9D|nr:heat shock 70 kDa protein 12B-like [Ruditapes philippinarum]
MADMDDSWYFFKEFKLLLYGEDFRKDMLIDDVYGRHLPLFEVMSKFIEGLKNHFIERKAKKGLDIKDVIWMLTVPAIWSLEGRDFMRKAAEHCGIDGKLLKIALEPEVAAVYCFTLPLEERKTMWDLGHIGQSFLVADLGGGTADLAAIKVNAEGTLDIIINAQGALIGGQNINTAFFQAIHDSFEGDQFKNVFRDPIELLEMEDDFEHKKVNIVSTKELKCSINLKIPSLFRDGLLKNDIRMTEEAKKKGGLKIHKDKLLFDPSYITEHFFKETCTRISHEIENMLKTPNVGNISIIVLVGGLSGSSVVVSQIQELLKKSFPEVKVVSPTSPFRAILTGAVLYGHNPKLIKSRRSPATFGVQTNSPFDAVVHKSDKKWIHSGSGKAYCKDIFSVHVREGELIVLNEKQPVKKYFPIDANQTEVNLKVFMHSARDISLDESKVLYTTDDGCTELGEMLVKMPDTSKGTNREVSVSFVIGAEIEVNAVDETSKEKLEVKFEFLKTLKLCKQKEENEFGTQNII